MAEDDDWQPSKINIVATYDYRDERGHLVYQCARLDPKSFLMRRPDGERWKYGINDVRKVMYRLPDLLTNPERLVLLCEGEKNVETLRAKGFLATTNPLGAGRRKWLPEFTKTLAGRHVTMLPDFDAIDPKTDEREGEEHARRVTRYLYPETKTLRVLWLPGLREGQDVTDWFARGGTAEQLRDLVRKTPVITSRKQLAAECVMPLEND